MENQHFAESRRIMQFPCPNLSEKFPLAGVGHDITQCSDCRELAKLRAYCGDGRRFIVKSDELLTAFLELEATLL